MDNLNAAPRRKYIRLKKPEPIKPKINISLENINNPRIAALIKKQSVKFNIDRQRVIDKYLNKTKSAKEPGSVYIRTDLIDSQNFYRSRKWLALRFDVLLRHGRTCMLCGVNAKPSHIDHIKPRSKYPELELDINNLQVLCHDCNMGKSNRDQTDFRPVKK